MFLKVLILILKWMMMMILIFRNRIVSFTQNKRNRIDGFFLIRKSVSEWRTIMKEEQEKLIKETGQTTLKGDGSAIHLLSIIGEIEGHDVLPNTTKSTKYEHVLPELAVIEDNPAIKGLLVIINTVGGDVEAGLAIAEMIASIGKPTVSLVLGGSHSIGVPIAVSTDYSYIVPTGTMVIHPVRMNGVIIGVRQSFDYFRQIQDRIVSFIENHCSIKKERLEELMMETGFLTKDVGSVLVGEDIVREGIINEVGGIHDAITHLRSMIVDEG